MFPSDTDQNKYIYIRIYLFKFKEILKKIIVPNQLNEHFFI